MSLNEDERKAVVAYRLEKSERAYEQAKGNLALGYVETTANRLYYAAYYAVSALLIANGDAAQTHNGVRSLFGLHFIKTGMVDKEIGTLYNHLFTCRLTGDYDDNYELSMEEVEPYVEPTGHLIEVVSELAHKTLSKIMEE